MRSSIACARCRRSKVKCVNNGVNTTCRDCEAKGRECTYPTPLAGGGGGAQRRDSGGLTKPLAEATPIGETPRRPKVKKPLAATGGNVSTKESMRALVDALDESILTPKVWIELFEIYQMHYSVDLPFLHAPTFLKPLRQMTATVSQPQDFGANQQGTTKPNTLPPAHPLLLLGFLTLTARFHPQLVAHHSPASSSRPSNPLIASEYYSAALRARISGNSGEGLGKADLARVQGLLMIATHEWGNCEGTKAFVSLGVAIRYAQLLGLQYQDDLDDEPQARSLAFNPSISVPGEAERTPTDESAAFIDQEIKRRTFWACFILDRYLSSGKHRPQMLHVNDLRLQLPVSERAFLFGDKANTQILTEDLDDSDPRASIQTSRRASLLQGTNGDTRSTSAHGASTPGSYRDHEINQDNWEVGPNEGVVSRYIKAMDLYGKIARWSCAGGRRRERFPPWDPQSQWYQLHKRLENFRERLPRDLTFSQANVSAHLSRSSSASPTPYVLLHTTLLLCSIVLHRDYIPFIPFRCNKPQGPLDPPLFPPNEYQIPPQWWERSAAELFKSSRDLITLLQTCREWGVNLVTPLVGFALYIAAFIGVYSNHFSWMDEAGYLCKKPGSTDSSGFEASRQAVEMVGQIRLYLRMADGWLKTISRIHRYFKRVKKEFDRNTKHLGGASGQPSPNESTFVSLREGGFGGGLEEYKVFERTLRDVGSLEDEDTEMIDAPDFESGHVGSSAASVAVKSEGMRMHESSPDSAAAARPDRWIAINNSAPAQHPTEPTTNGAAIAHYQPPSMPSGTSTPSQPASFPPNPYSNASDLASPLVSPATYGQGNFPQYPPQQHNIVQGHPHHLPPIQAQTQPAPPHLPAWTVEMRDAWLNNLDTTFSGDDIAAFIEGRTPSAPGHPGWLTTIWAGYSQAI